MQRRISRASEWYGLKSAIKAVVRFIPGYNRLIRTITRVHPSQSWITRLPVAPTDVNVFVRDQRLVMVKPDRCEIAKALWWTNGVRAPKEDAIALDLFFEMSRDADVVLDIGSNSGLFSLVAARSNPHARVIAFDLLPEAVELCLANIIRNNCATSVLPILAGIGIPDTTFRVPARVGSSCLPSSVSTDFCFDDGVDVPIVSLDRVGSFFPGNSRVVMKIDVEATEENIFEYGQDFLQRFRPTIICEVLPRAKVDRYSGILEKLGYRFELITPEGPQLRHALLPDSRYKDWLFVPHTDPGSSTPILSSGL